MPHPQTEGISHIPKCRQNYTGRNIPYLDFTASLQPIDAYIFIFSTGTRHGMKQSIFKHAAPAGSLSLSLTESTVRNHFLISGRVDD